MPVCKIFTEAVEDVFGFEVPEGLELEPFAKVIAELLDFDFDERKWLFEGVIG